MSQVQTLELLQPTFEGVAPREKQELRELYKALKEHMYATKPKRFAHSCGVCTTAAQLAQIYHADSFDAQAAGLLHDWDKVLSYEDQMNKAQEYHVDLGYPAEFVAPLLHGYTAAASLVDEFPQLKPEVFEAIKFHTTGAATMNTLDKVVFCADMLEPGRGDIEELVKLRASIGKVSLDELYEACFIQGMQYVLARRKVLYPPTLELYNRMVQTKTSVKLQAKTV